MAQVHVAEGQAVAAGAALVTLENDAQRAAVAQAQANLVGSEARLAQLRAGARPQEIAQAEAAVAAAQAHLDRLRNSPTPEQLASARGAVAVAQANLARAQAGPTSEQLNIAAAAMQAAEASLKQAQAAYDKVAWRSDIGALPQSVQLEQATIESQHASASYRNLAAGATPAELQVYRQQVAQAQAALAEVQAGPHPAEIAAAEAELARVGAGLALARAGARPEEIAAAEAQVTAAQAAVDQAQAALEQTVVEAPFAGTVHALDAAEGEYVAPGRPLVKLGDASAWLVETDNLSELDVVKLRVGDRVAVTLDAWPGQPLSGTVQQIQPAGQLKRGSVTYKVTVALDPTDLPLYWGLTAAVRKP
jgi:multidrug resistance efflux pump